MIERNKDNSFDAGEIDLEIFRTFGKSIVDDGYFNFISKMNGGFFYEKSLQIYGFSKVSTFHNIEYVNNIFQHEYGELSQEHVIFAQDALANQFSFTKNGIMLFNIETAKSEFLAKTFDAWLMALYDDLDYLTARKLLSQWTINHSFGFDQRLVAKKPFVIGGEYSVKNLYSQHFPTYISSNANIAKQIHDLPDGSQIEFRVVD